MTLTKKGHTDSQKFFEMEINQNFGKTSATHTHTHHQSCINRQNFNYQLSTHHTLQEINIIIINSNHIPVINISSSRCRAQASYRSGGGGGVE
jgi:hypothetical protein